MEASYVDGQLRARFADAMFRVDFVGSDDTRTTGYARVLIEHPSTPDRWMPLRVLEYFIQSWRALRREREGGEASPPPMLCVVVSHGPNGWTAARRFQDLVPELAEHPELRRLLPDFELIVDDLSAQPDEALLARPLGTYPELTLWVLRDGRTPVRLLAHVKVLAPLLERLNQESTADSLTLLRHIWRMVSGEQSFGEVRRRIVELAPSTEVLMATAGELLIQESIRRGETRGRAEGEARGKAEGVSVILDARGLTVTEEQRARIRGTAELGVLDR